MISVIIPFYNALESILLLPKERCILMDGVILVVQISSILYLLINVSLSK